MADVLGQQYNNVPAYNGLGNAFCKSYKATKAANSADKLYLGIIPAGVRVDEFNLIHDDTGTSVTCKVGYEPLDTLPAADDDYWFAAATDIAAAAANKQSIAHPIVFETPVKIVLTVAGANFTGTPSITAVVKGEMVGSR